MTRRIELDGVIVSSGFASGDRVVVGHWRRSPIGPVTDVMWAAPDGTRTLLAPTAEAAVFVAGVYRFDAVQIVPFRVDEGPATLTVVAGCRRVTFEAGRGLRVPVVRPAWFTRWVEGPIGRALLGVRTFGTSPTGVHEWYRATGYRPLRDATASIDGVDLGPMAPVDPPARFGFSEPPPRPSWVPVRPLLEYPPGRLPVPARFRPGRTAR